jgi:hypothetical protein
MGRGVRNAQPGNSKGGRAGYKVLARSVDVKEEGEFLFGFNPAGFVMRTMLVVCK